MDGQVRLMRVAVAAKWVTLFFGSVMLVVPLFLTPLLLFNPPKAYAATDTFNISGTWTAPAGVSSVTVEAWGGGGAGGGGSSGRGGGGGGAYSSGVVSVTAGNNYTVTVGDGGNIPGKNGGNSIFTGASTVSAVGGSGGSDNAGGAGGASSSGVGTTKFSGGDGGGVGGNGRGGGGGGGSATSTAIGGNGSNGQSNSGGVGGTGEGAGGAGGDNGIAGTNGFAPGGGGGGAGNGITNSANGSAGRVTLTYPLISVSVSDGTVAYGILATSTSKDTTSAGINDTQSATNDGTAAEDFNIIGQSSANWTLAASPGANQYSHQFCKAGSGSPDPCDSSPTWTSLTTSYQSLVSNIAASSNQRFDLKLNTPTSTSATAQQAVNITVQAVQH